MTARLPAKLGRRVLMGELTLDQALAIQSGGDEPAAKASASRVRQREDRGDDGLNQTERRYRDEVLEPARRSGIIVDYRMPCPVKLRIGPNWKCTLTLDALAVYMEGPLELVDVKATMRTRTKSGAISHRPLYQDDARPKIYGAASLFPWWRFVVAHPIPLKDGGGWARIEIGS